MPNIDIHDKIKSLEELNKIATDLRVQNKVIVHCHGVFDLVHPGHIRHFYSAKKQGDVLFLTLTADEFVKRGPGRPIFNQNIRAETLAALSVSDYVGIVFEPTAKSAIQSIRPNFYAKGPDYKDKDKDITGQISADEETVTNCGGQLLITNDSAFSSSKLINNHLDVYPSEVLDFLQKFAQQYSSTYITEQINNMMNLRILVIGDSIIDQYHYCSTMNKTGKEPLVANKYISNESFAGGAIATANHIGNICSNVTLFTILGRKDSWEDFIRKQTEQTGIKLSLFYRDDAETTVKRRFISDTNNRKLFEICFMNDNPISELVENDIVLDLEEKIHDYDLVIVNDFGHGFLTPRIIDVICKKANKLALNVQTNSANTGFNLITKYSKADFICVDEIELRYATHDRFSSLDTLMREIQTKMNCALMITTRGPKGTFSFSAPNNFYNTPALADKVIDAVGAGDALFAYAAPAFASNVPHEVISFVGNAVGAIAVQIMGNRDSVKKIDVLKFITRLLNQ